METICEYIKLVVADSRQGVISSLMVWPGLKIPHHEKNKQVTKCCVRLWTWTNSLGWPEKEEMDMRF